MPRCREMVVGYIIRPDGYRCDLCARHLENDWPYYPPQPEGYTFGVYPIAERSPNFTCQRIVPDIEVIRVPPPAPDHSDSEREA